MQKTKTFKKKPSIPKVCELCGKDYLSKDWKTKICYECKDRAKVCECGEEKHPRAKYCQNCRQTKYSHTRGKTYEEILGKDKAKQLRASKAFVWKERGKRADGFRSTYETDFAAFLESHNIIYEYEADLKGIESTWTKFVDFFIPQLHLYIELSGYIWAAGHLDRQAKFQGRIVELASLLPQYEFIVAGEPALVPKIQESFEGFYTYPSNKPIKIMSLYELRAYIKNKIGEINDCDKKDPD